MKTSKKLIKKAICLFLIAILNINTFGAIVSDNDGSAFITKAEFDALKSSFQAQIDEYNSSIDAKIDGAIAAYLAGIKLAVSTEENFFDGNGQDVFIGNISYIDNLKHGRAELDYNLSSTYGGTSSDTSAQVLMTRKTEYDRDYFESFFCDNINDKFLYYSDKQQFKIAIKSYSVVISGWSSYTKSDSVLTMRWHAYESGRGINWTGKNPTEITHYSDCIAEWWYLRTYGTKLNFTLVCYPSYLNSKGHIKYSAEVSNVTEDINKIKYMMTDDINTHNIWSITNNTSNPILDPKNWYAAVPNKPYDTSISTQYAIPTNANIISETYGAYRPNNENSNIIYPIRSFSWVTAGTWNKTVDEVTNTSLPWYEPLPTLSTYDHTNLVHDAISEDMLIDYAPYEWKGKLTEGLPIAIFDQDTAVEFTIDTTEFGSDLVFAFSTEPFNPTVNRIYNQPEDEKLTITIDKNEVEGSGQAVVTPDVHNVKVELKTDEDTPIFFKMGLPENVADTSLRGTVALPKLFQKTVMS